ncbi:MAG: EamA family transporter RarD [Spirochaetes bacterium]|nr:EamA family transporter RarD [Spirochaetota bacterium]
MKRNEIPRNSEVQGALAAFAAYSMWGLFPLYWKQLEGVESLQILAHRIFWAGLLCFGLMAAKGRLVEIIRIVRDSGKIFLVLCAALIVTVNWGLFIWAVNNGRITESALGYYINPLLSVAFGALFFKEKVGNWTRVAVIVAAIGILAAAIVYGSVPWVSLLLALTFASYGVIKKKLNIEPLAGLTIETLVIAPFALAFIVARQSAGTGAFVSAGVVTTILLCLAGLITAVPLFFFAKAANTISLQKMGFIQYISPTGQLFLGLVVFHERPSPALLVAFASVLVAVVIYLSTWKRVP